MRNMFDYFSNRYKILVCDSKKDAYLFAKYMHDNGLKYQNGDDYLDFWEEDWRKDCAYDLLNRTLTWKEGLDGFKVIHSSDFIFEKEEKPCKFMKKV